CGSFFTASINCVVDPTASASAITSAGDSGCTSTPASGCSCFIFASACALNASCTTHEPGHNNTSAPVTDWMYAPKCLSGAQRIFFPCLCKCAASFTAMEDVTT